MVAVPGIIEKSACATLLGFMRPDTRPQIVELADSAKAEVANVIAEIGEDDPTREGRRALAFRAVRPLRNGD
jgi:hypothetical protein